MPPAIPFKAFKGKLKWWVNLSNSDRYWSYTLYFKPHLLRILGKWTGASEEWNSYQSSSKSLSAVLNQAHKMKLRIVCFFTNSGPVVTDPFSPRIDSYCLLVSFVLYPENPAWQSWGWGPQNDRQTEVRLPLHFLHLRSCQRCQLSEELSESFLPLLAFGRGCGSWRGFYTFSGDSYCIQVLVKCKSMCLKHNQAKQYQNVKVWSRERFIESQLKRWVAYVLKTLGSPKALSNALF